MNIDRGMEHYRFTCRHCARTWDTDYEVRAVTDSDGNVWAVHYRNGVTAENPAGELIVCPGCQRTTVTAHLIARRDLPGPPRTDTGHG